MRNRPKISLVLGSIVLVASIVIYIITPSTPFPSSILGFCFLLYSEMVLFGGFALIDLWPGKYSKLLLWSGVGVCFGLYAAAVFLSSLIFMIVHTIAIQSFLIVQIVLFIAAAAICLIIVNFSERAKRSEQKVLEAEYTVQHAIDQLILIREYADKKSDVDKLIEDLRFSDTSVTVDSDDEIIDAITSLKRIVQSDDPDEDAFSNAIEEIAFFIKKRGLQTRFAKQGGI